MSEKLPAQTVVDCNARVLYDTVLDLSYKPTVTNWNGVSFHQVKQYHSPQRYLDEGN